MNGTLGGLPNPDNISYTFMIKAPPYVFWCFLSVETVLIVFGNTMVCWLVATSKRLQTKQNIFIVSLAVSDMLVGLSVAPCEYCHMIKHKLKVSDPTCPVFCGSVISFDMIASVVNLTLIAGDRYFSIQKPFKYYEVFSKRFAGLVVIIGWVVAITLTCIPTLWMHKPLEQNYRSNIIYTIVLFAMTILTGFLLFLLYFTIIQTIRRKIRATKEESPNKSGIKVCVISVVSFFISWLPYVVIEILLQCNVYFEGLFQMMDATYFILLLNPCINPFLYAYYRQDFRNALFAWAKRRKETLVEIYPATQKRPYFNRNDSSRIISRATTRLVINDDGEDAVMTSGV